MENDAPFLIKIRSLAKKYNEKTIFEDMKFDKNTIIFVSNEGEINLEIIIFINPSFSFGTISLLNLFQISFNHNFVLNSKIQVIQNDFLQLLSIILLLF